MTKTKCMQFIFEQKWTFWKKSFHSIVFTNYTKQNRFIVLLFFSNTIADKSVSSYISAMSTFHVCDPLWNVCMFNEVISFCKNIFCLSFESKYFSLTNISWKTKNIWCCISWKKSIIVLWNKSFFTWWKNVYLDMHNLLNATPLVVWKQFDNILQYNLKLFKIHFILALV